MWRKAVAGFALSVFPLKQARRADAAGIEGIPLVVALAEPGIVFARLPSAQRAANAGTGRALAGAFRRLNVEVRVQNLR